MTTPCDASTVCCVANNSTKRAILTQKIIIAFVECAQEVAAEQRQIMAAAEDTAVAFSTNLVFAAFCVVAWLGAIFLRRDRPAVP